MDHTTYFEYSTNMCSGKRKRLWQKKKKQKSEPRKGEQITKQTKKFDMRNIDNEMHAGLKHIDRVQDACCV